MRGKGILVALLVVALGFIFFIFNPSTTALFPKCPFLMLTGFRCPGCGSQRAVHSLLHLDFTQAFSYNALLVLSLPVIILLLYAEIMREKKPDLYGKIHRPVYIWIYFTIVIMWGICRNIFNL